MKPRAAGGVWKNVPGIAGGAGGRRITAWARWNAFARNFNFVVRTSGAADRAPLASPGAELRRLGETLRAIGYDNTPAGGPGARFALGYTIDPGALPPGVPPELRERVGPGVRLKGAVLATGSVLAFLPRDGHRRDSVYAGPDTAYLVDAVERLGPAWSGPAVDLGTGTGVAAATLALGHEVVVATDIASRSAHTAALTATLNRFPPGHRMVSCVADVAAGLRPGRFGVVVANAPRVPSGSGRARLFADGGPTGFELPRRFLDEGTGLLRPGGIMILLTLDVPPLHGVLRARVAEGYATAVVATGLADGHVAALLARPPVAPAFAAYAGALGAAWRTSCNRRGPAASLPA